MSVSRILGWWHGHTFTYPVLSIHAKDITTVPASTISSESTFSLVGTVIEECRRRLYTKHGVGLIMYQRLRVSRFAYATQSCVVKDTTEIEIVLESLNNDRADKGISQG
jgi:hypothetical protein